MGTDDEALVSSIAAGDAAAEEELFLRFQPRVRAMVETALRHGPDSEDLTCEILEGVIAGLRRGAFRGECRPGTFIYAVARNKIREYFRRRRPDTAELTDAIPSSAPGPDQGVVQRELDEAIDQAMAGLRTKYRTVLYLHYGKEMAIGEIARLLQVPPRRVSEWKDYGLEVLRSRSGRFLNRFR